MIFSFGKSGFLFRTILIPVAVLMIWSGPTNGLQVVDLIFDGSSVIGTASICVVSDSPFSAQGLLSSGSDPKQKICSSQKLTNVGFWLASLARSAFYRIDSTSYSSLILARFILLLFYSKHCYFKALLNETRGCRFVIWYFVFVSILFGV